jgi:hypothetical protein
MSKARQFGGPGIASLYHLTCLDSIGGHLGARRSASVRSTIAAALVYR